MSLTGHLREHRVRYLVAFAAVAGIVLFLLRDGTPAASYRTEAVSRGDVRVTVSATGKVQPTNQVEVGSEQSGIVSDVLVEENEAIRKGQVLARLDTAKLANTVARAEASLEAARAGVLQAAATTREHRATLDRLRRMHAMSNGGIPSAADLEAAEASLARSTAAEASARAAITEANAVLLSARTDLAKASIRSPIDGIVLSRNVEAGQTVAASLQAPVLFTLAEDLARMEIVVDIDEADVGKVGAGQKATFTVDAWPDRTYPAVLQRISYGAKNTDGVVSYRATLAVDNADLSLRPGMTATATIETLHRVNVLRVPNAALRFNPAASDGPAASPSSSSIVSRLLPRPPQSSRRGGSLPPAGKERQVHVLDAGMPRAIPVTTGQTDGRYTELVDGELAEGREVIVARIQEKSAP